MGIGAWQLLALTCQHWRQSNTSQQRLTATCNQSLFFFFFLFASDTWQNSTGSQANRFPHLGCFLFLQQHKMGSPHANHHIGGPKFVILIAFFLWPSIYPFSQKIRTTHQSMIEESSKRGDSKYVPTPLWDWVIKFLEYEMKTNCSWIINFQIAEDSSRLKTRIKNEKYCTPLRTIVL